MRSAPGGAAKPVEGRAGTQVPPLSFVGRMVIFPGIIEVPGRIGAVGWPARPLKLAHSKALNRKQGLELQGLELQGLELQGLEPQGLEPQGSERNAAKCNAMN